MSEFDIQRDIFKKFAHLDLMYATGSGLKLPIGLAVKAKMSGIVKLGLPDLVLPMARGNYHGLYLELKTETGKVSPEQSFFMSRLRSEDYYAAATFGYEQTEELINKYLRGELT